jgi:uncharacterized protein (DUF58 family)
MSNLAALEVQYQERVLPKWSSFLPILIVYPTFWLTMAPFNALLGSIFGIAVTLAIAAVMFVSSPKITVSASEVRVGRAHISRKLLGTAYVVEKQDQFLAKGPQLDARAYLSLQPSVSGLVRMEIKDPKDPTPYWLFSTRKPELVAELIGAKSKR